MLEPALRDALGRFGNRRVVLNRHGSWATMLGKAWLLACLPRASLHGSFGQCRRYTSKIKFAATDGVSSNGYVCDLMDAHQTMEPIGGESRLQRRHCQHYVFRFDEQCAWWCPGDGWEGDFSMHDESGSQIATMGRSDDNPSGTHGTAMSQPGYVYVKIKGKIRGATMDLTTRS